MARRKRTRGSVEYQSLFFGIRRWHASGSCYRDIRHDKTGRFQGCETWHHLQVEIDAEPLVPVHSASGEVPVARAELSLVAHAEANREGRVVSGGIDYSDGGGYFEYRRDEGGFLRGYLTFAFETLEPLLSVLAANRRVVITTHGPVLYRRRALIGSLGWYTTGHPTLDDEWPTGPGDVSNPS